MYIIQTYPSAVLFCILTMIAWGSWPNTQKLVSKDWRFELFYWDFVTGIAAVALFGAFTAGSLGPAGRPFLADLLQADRQSVWLAGLGGAVFNCANILFVAAISLAGISTAFPIGAGAGLVLGVILNYVSQPVGNGLLLFAGVFLIVIAMLLSAQMSRQLSGRSPVKWKGIALAVVAGLLFGVFYRFVAASMATDFSNPEPGLLGPYGSVVVFSGGIFISNLMFNTLLMKHPIQGNPIDFRQYWSGSSGNHLLGITGGAIWGIGLLFSILSSEKAGFAISFGLSQGNALVAALWGILVWKEVNQASKKVNGLLIGMFSAYILGLVCIILAKVY
ncbi:GRP family sugar transporter [Larkinella harenae]